MPSVQIRPVERFPEPGFSQLQRSVFADLEVFSPEHADALRQEAEARKAMKGVAAPNVIPMYRLGAYRGDRLIGWSVGWMERGRIFYMANSGVLHEERRKGIYGRLLQATCEHAQAMGAVMLRSQHSVLNNPILLAKLKFGFHISGFNVSAAMGSLVELSYHFQPGRQAVYRSRTIPYAERQS